MVEYTICMKELELLKARFAAAEQVARSAQELVQFIAQREGLDKVEFNLATGEFTSPDEEKKED